MSKERVVQVFLGNGNVQKQMFREPGEPVDEYRCNLIQKPQNLILKDGGKNVYRRENKKRLRCSFIKILE